MNYFVRFCQFLGGISMLLIFLCEVSAQNNSILGRWVYVAETYNENLVRAYGPLSEYTNADSLKSKISKEKADFMGAYDMVFDKKGTCHSQGVDFKYEFSNGILTMNWLKYAIHFIDESRLEMCEVTGGNCILFYAEEFYNQLSQEQLTQALAFTSYDRLLIKYILDRRHQATRTDLYKTQSAPKHKIGLETAIKLIDQFIGYGDKTKKTDELVLQFVIEADGTTSGVGLDVIDTHLYERLQEVFEQLDGQWIPITKEGEPIPCQVQIPIKSASM